MRLSITTIEAFRLWRDTGDWMSLEDFEATVKRATVPNEKMLRGSAFHKVLETCKGETALVYEADGFRFSGDGMPTVLDLWPHHGAKEVKATMDVDGITVVGQADSLIGTEVWEAKCVERIDVDKYEDSFQWRAYLKLYNASVCRYVLAEGRDIGHRDIIVSSCLPMPMYRYKSLDDDVRRLTSECAEFIEQRNLTSYVLDKEAA